MDRNFFLPKQTQISRKSIWVKEWAMKCAPLRGWGSWSLSWHHTCLFLYQIVLLSVFLRFLKEEMMQGNDNFLMSGKENWTSQAVMFSTSRKYFQDEAFSGVLNHNFVFCSQGSHPVRCWGYYKQQECLCLLWSQIHSLRNLSSNEHLSVVHQGRVLQQSPGQNPHSSLCPAQSLPFCWCAIFPAKKLCFLWLL